MAGRASPILRRGRQQRSATTAADAATPAVTTVSGAAIEEQPLLRHNRATPGTLACPGERAAWLAAAVQRARWMTSEQGQRIPAEVGGSLTPTAAAMYELVEVIQKDAPPMRRHSGMCR